MTSAEKRNKDPIHEFSTRYLGDVASGDPQDRFVRFAALAKISEMAIIESLSVQGRGPTLQHAFDVIHSAFGAQQDAVESMFFPVGTDLELSDDERTELDLAASELAERAYTDITDMRPRRIE